MKMRLLICFNLIILAFGLQAQESGLSIRRQTVGNAGYSVPVELNGRFYTMQASIGQSSAILIVAEPTVSGIHDMKRVGELAAHFKIPAMVCINKFDLNPDQTREIETIAREKNILMAGKIPFDPAFTKAMIQIQTLLEYDDGSPAAEAVRQIWETVMAHPAMKLERLM